MNALAAAWRGEWEKLLGRKKYIVFLIVGIVICIVWALLGRALSDFARERGGVTLNLAPTPMGALPFFLQILVPFLMFMGITDLITVEGADGTMRAMVSRPVERWKLYTAKIFAVMAYAGGYLMCIFFACALLSLTGSERLGASDILTSLASYALTLIPLAVLAAFAALIALLGRSGTLIMFLLILSYLALSVLPVFFPILSEMLFTSYLGWHRLWIGALPAAQKLVNMLLIVLGSGTVLYTAGSLMFEKMEY